MALSRLLEKIQEKDKEIDRLNDIISKFISGYDVIPVRGDYWVAKEDGEYKEMTEAEIAEYSKR